MPWQTIADRWRIPASFRVAASDVLGRSTPTSVPTFCRRFFVAEEDAKTKQLLAHAVLSQFTEEGVEPVRQLVSQQDEEPTGEGSDLRYRLVAVCAIIGESFPKYKKWYADAVANHWGLVDYRPPRLADTFRLDQPGPEWSRNGKRLRWLG